MKILVTNDDGIQSEGLAVLVRWATSLGSVWVAAPTTQQSGKSHAITIHQPFCVEQTQLGLGEIAAFAVESTPVDCVRFATLGLKMDFDLILSGVNKGFNLGEDILYSGTVGAIFEAALRKTHGIAFSTVHTTFQYAADNLDKVYRYILEQKLFDKNLIYNVNIPENPKGIVMTHQGGPYFSDEWQFLDNGQWQQNGFCVHNNTHNIALDTDATVDGYITISPMTTDRSNRNIVFK